MVITYSIEELHSIGNMLSLKQCIDQHKIQKQPPPIQLRNEFQENLIHLQRHLEMLGHPIQVSDGRSITNQFQHHQQPDQSQQPLTSSVAEFFKRAKQNSHFSISIDPTKVRRLSDVEAELMADRC